MLVSWSLCRREGRGRTDNQRGGGVKKSVEADERGALGFNNSAAGERLPR